MIIDSLKYNGACSCGREHIMQTEFCIIESGCLKNIDKYLKEYDLSGFTVVVYDENTYKATDGRHPQGDLEIILNPENLHANEIGVKLLMDELKCDPDVMIAVGSGTVHDLTRYCAYLKSAEFVSCPTAASVDGFCSSVAAMTWNGCKKTLTAISPKIVVADIDIIKSSPLYLAKSGFGDMVGKYVALTDWKISNIISGEFYCERISSITLDATDAVIEALGGIINAEESAYEKLMYGLIMSGLAMQMMGNSRPASGAEHHISHIIEMSPANLFLKSDALHGEKVGVGTLLAIAEYKRIRKIKNISFKDYDAYSQNLIFEVFGKQMSAEINEENKKDMASGVKAESLMNNWNSICEQIDKLPDIEHLTELFSSNMIKATLEDIGVSGEMKEKLFDYSPMVRNRITLMRLRKCVK